MNIDNTLKIRNMKRFLLGFILILSVLFTFMGCSEENVKNEGTLDIQLATSGTKGVAPSVSLDAESYHIVVRNSSSVSVFDETVKIDADLVIALEPGLYNVAVDALNGDGKVIGRGTADGTVEAGKSTVLSISILEVEGKGTLSINISAENSRNIGYEVLSSTGSFITSGSLSYKDGKHTAEAELSNGFYVLRIKDSDTGKTLKIESFRIVSDCTTTYDSAVSSSSSPSSSTSYRVGDIGPAGGYVFYDCDADNDTGNADGLISTSCGWRYLEAAPADLRIVNGTPTVDSTLSGYSSGTYEIYYGYYRTSASSNELYVNGTTTYDSYNCTGTEIGTGKNNTSMLVSTMGDEAYKNYHTNSSNTEKISDYAARLCDILEYTKDGVTYTDWFLPSIYELNLMYTNLHEQGLGGFEGSSVPYYWSSSEDDGDAFYAWEQDFGYGGQGSSYRNYILRVRPARAFLTDEICEHTWDDGEITSEASCEYNGIITYTCTECNMTKVEIIPMIDHIYGDWITLTAATTSSDGEKYRTCSVCGHEETEVIPKISTATYTVGSIGPSGGYIFYDCDADNDFGNADGLKSSECGWRYLEAAPADLKIVNGTPTVDSTLSGYSSGTYEIYYGYYRTSASGNELYVNGTTTYDSSNCTGTAVGTGKNNTSMLVSTMGDEAYKYYHGSSSNTEKISDYAARLCDILEYTKDGVKYDDWFLPSRDELNLMYTSLHEQGLGGFEGSRLPWYWSSSEDGQGANGAWVPGFDSGGHGRYYRRSLYRVRPARAFLDDLCDHTWDDGKITTPATCGSNGIKTYTCTECNMTKVEIIPMIDHIYGEWITRTAATTSSEGEKYRTCTICGHEETGVIPKLSNITYKVGEIGPSGGYIFYDCDADNDTGNADGLISTSCGWRYLEAAPSDLRIVDGTPTVDSTLSGYSSGTYEFYYGLYRTSADGDALYVNGTTEYDSSNCTGTAIGTGKNNTELLTKVMGDAAYYFSSGNMTFADYAARLCDILEYTKDGVTYTDWFLPSKEELNLMYTNLHEQGLGGFEGSSEPLYWSSSEDGNNEKCAWRQGFNFGSQFNVHRNSAPNRVRPARAF